MDGTFRVAVGLLAATSLSIAVYHRRKVNREAKIPSRPPPRRSLEIALRMVATALGAAVLCYLIYPETISWGSMGLVHIARWSGAVIGGLGIALMYISLDTLGRNYSSTTETRAGSELVVSGPYRWVRHPYYVAAILMVVATTLLADNWIIGGLGIIMIVLLVLRTPIEEEALVREFGDAYTAYQRRTGRFFPRC